MPNITVFLGNIFDGLAIETKLAFLKIVEELVEKHTGLKNRVQLADSKSKPSVIVAMYDFGNMSGLKIAALGALIRFQAIAFFFKNSIILKPSDVDVTVASSTVRA